MRAIFLILASACLVGAQGWTDLTNTHLQDVCPADGVVFSGGTVSGIPYSANCFKIYTSWSSGAVDTKRNRLLIMGDGHDGATDNAVYSLDLVTRSASSGTNCGSATNCSTNASAPTMTRLNDPTPPTFTPTATAWGSVTCGSQNANSDGSPIAQQTYQTLIYLPQSDALFDRPTGNLCGASPNGPAYILNLSTMAWTTKSSSGADAGGGTNCALDSSYTGGGDAVICMVSVNILKRYVVNTDTWSTLANAWTIRTGATLVVDPKRHLVFFIGPAFDFASPAIMSADLNNPTAALVDWTSSVTGCANMMGSPYPGLVYDPALNRIVGYQPMTAAAPGVAANIITIFDPATKTCVDQPQLGGAGPSAHSSILAGQGMFGRFNYVPSLGKYVVCNNSSADCYTFALNLTPTHGIGASTLTCLDRDGDGYGTGPGCSGADADDQDSGVHTAAQFTTKWTDIPTGLKHLGYNPANIWYVATTGNDGTGAVNNAALPFATCCGSGKANPAAGDAVLMRGGTYSFNATAVSGTAGNPTIFMSYPGELAQFTSNPSGFSFQFVNYSVFDAVKVVSNGSNAGVALEDNNNVIMRHIDTSGNEWGIDAGADIAALTDVTVEDSVMHDNTGVGAQHGLYFACHSGLTCTNVFLRRNLYYGNDYTGRQFNGIFSNLIDEQSISYSNLLAGASWLEGVSNSTFQGNMSINDGQGGLVISNYDGNEGVTACGMAGMSVCNCVNYASICANDQTGNIIQNYTVFLTGFDRTGAGSCNGSTDAKCEPALQVARQSGCTTMRCVGKNLGGNTFRNTVFVTNNTYTDSASTYPPIQFPDSTGVTFIGTSAFANTLWTNLSNTSVLGYGPGSSFGLAGKSCSQMTSLAASNAGCTNSSPLFTATCAYNTIGTCNLRPQAGSPALAAGTAPQYPRFDLLGVALSPTAPTLGAFEIPTTGGSSFGGKMSMGGKFSSQ